MVRMNIGCHHILNGFEKNSSLEELKPGPFSLWPEPGPFPCRRRARSACPVARPSRATRFPLLETLARTIRAMRYSIRTEQSYVDWGIRFLTFRGDKPAESPGVEDLQRFLSYLAIDRSVSAKTQAVAF